MRNGTHTGIEAPGHPSCPHGCTSGNAVLDRVEATEHSNCGHGGCTCGDSRCHESGCAGSASASYDRVMA